MNFNEFIGVIFFTIILSFLIVQVFHGFMRLVPR